LKIEDAGFYEQLFAKIIKHHYMPVIERKLRIDPFELKLAESALLMLLEPFLRNMESSVDGQREAALLRMVKITGFIEENLDKPIKLNDLSKLVSLNPTYLSNLFTSLIGVSPICYYNQQRIERAKRLLGNTNLRISEIAVRCGADSLDSFYKIFLRHTNMSPTEYREKIQTEE
jgi:transcriptional regulator GlxA family with amidase domain